ncbi:MAG TPA: holo-ACP synthase [Acidimicrobiales bacterium]|nr:holo-ACP synthase [Acidimicrobiales bacterium]
MGTIADGVVGVGTDLVDLDRFRDVLARTPSIVDRLFTADERAYAERQRDPTPRLAARFAAKEAVLKSLGVGLGAASLRDIEVVRAESGAPAIVLHGGAAEVAAARGVARFAVSLSHTDLVAGATVLALGPGVPPT